MICEHAASEEPPAAAPQTGDSALTARETRSGVRAPVSAHSVNYVFRIPDALASGASLTSGKGRVLKTANTHLAAPLIPHGPHPRGGLTVRQGVRQPRPAAGNRRRRPPRRAPEPAQTRAPRPPGAAARALAVLLCALTPPRPAALHVPTRHGTVPPLGNCEYRNVFPIATADLLASSCLNNNKTYISTHGCWHQRAFKDR